MKNLSKQVKIVISIVLVLVFALGAGFAIDRVFFAQNKETGLAEGLETQGADDNAFLLMPDTLESKAGEQDNDKGPLSGDSGDLDGKMYDGVFYGDDVLIYDDDMLIYDGDEIMSHDINNMDENMRETSSSPQNDGIQETKQDIGRLADSDILNSVIDIPANTDLTNIPESENIILELPDPPVLNTDRPNLIISDPPVAPVNPNRMLDFSDVVVTLPEPLPYDGLVALPDFSPDDPKPAPMPYLPTDPEIDFDDRSQYIQNIDHFTPFPVPEYGNLESIEEWEGMSASALELICEDDSNQYYLTSIRSGLIMLNFTDGSRHTLRDALEAGLVGINELIAHGLEVHIASK